MISYRPIQKEKKATNYRIYGLVTRYGPQSVCQAQVVNETRCSVSPFGAESLPKFAFVQERFYLSLHVREQTVPGDYPTPTGNASYFLFFFFFFFFRLSPSDDSRERLLSFNCKKPTIVTARTSLFAAIRKIAAWRR